MNNKFLWASPGISKEYCATVVKVGPVSDVPGTDFLGYTLIEGFPIVVRKDQVKEGEVMVYCQNETELCINFLSANNAFGWECKELNSNYTTEILPLIESDQKEEAKKKVGFIEKSGRIRIIRLRGQISMGILFPKEAIVKWKPSLADINLEEYVGQDFDMVEKELFIKAYVPRTRKKKPHTPSAENTGRKEKGFNRIEPRFFQLHYDTQNLQRCPEVLRPEDKVDISVKFHGTSGVFANVLVRARKNRTTFQKHIFRWARKRHGAFRMRKNSEWWAYQFLQILSRNTWRPDYKYGNVYSSRTVIKNKREGAKESEDIWQEYNNLLKAYLPEGYTVYGEICGYKTGTSTMIQKGYDYGCKEGENFFMPYRITYRRNQFEKTKDLEISEVVAWTKKLLFDHPELKDKVRPLVVLFSGKLKDRYPEVPVGEDWGKEIVKAIENDTKLGMEGLEEYCKVPVPREGVCMRIEKDPVAECFKCKCKSFLFHESKSIDSGEVDIEMEEHYNETSR